MATRLLPEPIILTQEQQEALNGALLGDGSLVIHKNCTNAYFTYTSKSQQHVEFIAKYFRPYMSNNQEVRYMNYFDKRTDKTYERYVLKTGTNITFTNIYNKWYNGIKHIPKDLILTPLTCLIWYIGDGNMELRTTYIRIATDCFLKQELEEIILPQLKQFEASLDRGKNDLNHPDLNWRVYIPHRHVKEFLSYIGNCPFPDYEYKWNVKEYINSIPRKTSEETKKKVVELYKQGVNYYQAAKALDIEPATARRILIKEEIYTPPNELTKNAIIAYNSDGTLYNIYISSAEASRQVGISPSLISSVIHGRNKTAAGYTWKKYKDLSDNEQIIIRNQFPNYFKGE